MPASATKFLTHASFSTAGDHRSPNSFSPKPSLGILCLSPRVLGSHVLTQVQNPALCSLLCLLGSPLCQPSPGCLLTMGQAVGQDTTSFLLPPLAGGTGTCLEITPSFM